MRKPNTKKVKKDKEIHKCPKCGTKELILKGAHWDELYIPAGFFCHNCKYLAYTIWDGYGNESGFSRRDYVWLYAVGSYMKSDGDCIKKASHALFLYRNYLCTKNIYM